MILPHPIAFLLDREFHAGTPEAAGRVTVFEEPQVDWLYCLGFDAGYGITGRDRSSITGIGVEPGTEKKIQVLQAVGQWGSPQLARMCYALGIWFNTAFILGEAQVGLATLQSLYADFAYPFLYYQRDENKKTRPVSEKLGYWAGEKMTDPAFQGLRNCVIEKGCEFCDQELIDEMACLQWFNSREKDGVELVGDALLKVRLPVGADGKRRSPDLVMGAAYAHWAACEVPKYDRTPDRKRYLRAKHYREEKRVADPMPKVASWAKVGEDE